MENAENLHEASSENRKNAHEDVQETPESTISESTSESSEAAPLAENTNLEPEQVAEHSDEVSSENSTVSSTAEETPVEEQDAIAVHPPEAVEDDAEVVPSEDTVETDPDGIQVDSQITEVEDATTDSNEATSSQIVEEDPEEEHQKEPEEVLDFEHASKPELLTKLKEVKNEEDIARLDRVLKAIKPRFDELYELAKNEALQRFVSDGNEADDFEYHSDEQDKEFIGLYGLLKARRNKHYKELESQKESNLKLKESLLEQLRQIVDGEESSNSINAVRDLQAEWKKIGPVPGAHNKTLWANYNALLDRYYDNRSIYFELKDLDRKKNLRLKEELCQKAEDLGQLEDIKTAIIQLNDLHEEYKHIGPVPQEEQEPLWQRFKAASDHIYTRRKAYFDELKVIFEENLVKKEALIQEVQQFLHFDSDRITDWNSKTKEILELQKRWEEIGGVPREKAKTVNKDFWNTFKKFFANKNQFFKVLESKREDNLQQKLELITQAEALRESDDWNATAQKLKDLQAQWKDIGPVPEKVRNETYGKFKAACDHFFNKRRDQNQEKFKSYEENLKLKLQICDQLEQQGTVESVELDPLYDLIDNYTAIGFVPKNAIKKMHKRFDDVIASILANESIDEGDRTDLRNHVQMGRLRNTPGGERKIQRKEHSIRRKIQTLENDINTWNTNMDFFASSATADKLKEELQQRINHAKGELEELKSQLASFY